MTPQSSTIEARVLEKAHLALKAAAAAAQNTCTTLGLRDVDVPSLVQASTALDDSIVMTSLWGLCNMLQRPGITDDTNTGKQLRAKLASMYELNIKGREAHRCLLVLLYSHVSISSRLRVPRWQS